jgi:hypothetical protein
MSAQPDEADAIASITDLDFDQSAFDTVTYADGAWSVIDEIRFGTSFANVTGMQVDPFPHNGETIFTDKDTGMNVELSWTNLPSAADSNDIWVDVWLGTEPNELSLDYDMAPIVDATAPEGLNADAVTQYVSGTPDTYYWRVNSYVYGADNIDDANMIEGDLWTFNTTNDKAPESANAGANMITWSQQQVELTATVVDDGTSDLTYAWSADAPDGVIVEFDPVAADSPDPKVTITKVPTSLIAVPDASFEDHVLADGGYEDIGTAGYTGAWESNSGDAWIDYGYWRADGYPEDLYANSGNNKAYAYEDYIYQILPVTFIEGRTYTLSVLVGQPFADSPSDWALYFTTEDHTVEVSDANGMAGLSWGQVSLTYTATDDDAGKKIGIKMWGASDVAFDDVQLTVDPPVAPPVVTVELSLAVHDEFNQTPIEDTMTIDVYDDECAAARIGTAADNPADFNKDCVIGLGDLVLMAAKWLDDNSLTEPVAKPSSGGGFGGRL